MTRGQPSLFDAPPTAGTHRKRDPQTSVDAAAAVDVPARAQQVYDALATRPSGAIPAELVDILRATDDGWQQNWVGRRLDDLEQVGLARRTGVTRVGRYGRKQIEWVAVAPEQGEPRP